MLSINTDKGGFFAIVQCNHISIAVGHQQGTMVHSNVLHRNVCISDGGKCYGLQIADGQ